MSEDHVVPEPRQVFIENDMLLNEPAFAAVFEMPGTFWKIVTVMPYSRATVDSNLIYRNLIGAILVAMLISLLVMLFVVRRILVRPIADMSRQLKALSEDAESNERPVVLTDSGNFPSDVYVAEELLAALGQGHVLKRVAPEEVEGALDAGVAVLMLTEVDYRTGRLHDMARLTRAAHAAGALTLPVACALARRLAEHFGTVWVHEYARPFLETRNDEVHGEDFPFIVRGQACAEASMARRANRLLFVDTDALTTRLYHEFFVGPAPAWLQKAADLSGLGTGAIRWVSAGPGQRMDTAALRRQIRADRDAGCRPFMAVATAGTVSTGAVDDLATIGAICREEGLWFHVDGAYGAPAAALEELARQILAIQGFTDYESGTTFNVGRAGGGRGRLAPRQATGRCGPLGRARTRRGPPRGDHGGEADPRADPAVPSAQSGCGRRRFRVRKRRSTRNRHRLTYRQDRRGNGSFNFGQRSTADCI